MKFNIHGKKLEVTESIKGYIESKIGRLDKYFEDPDNITATVVIKLVGKKQVVEVTINTHSFVIRGEESNNDLYASIDKDIDILEGQIRKIKSKRDKTNMTESIRLKEASQTDDDDDVESEVIKTLYYSIKPLTAEDAKLILQGDPKNKFLPFINVETDQVNVIYKLKDGKNFGLVEPEA